MWGRLFRSEEKNADGESRIDIKQSWRTGCDQLVDGNAKYVDEELIAQTLIILGCISININQLK